MAQQARGSVRKDSGSDREESSPEPARQTPYHAKELYKDQMLFVWKETRHKAYHPSVGDRVVYKGEEFTVTTVLKNKDPVDDSVTYTLAKTATNDGEHEADKGGRR